LPENVKERKGEGEKEKSRKIRTRAGKLKHSHVFLIRLFVISAVWVSIHLCFQIKIGNTTNSSGFCSNSAPEAEANHFIHEGLCCGMPE
jgi:hypothetical protein